MGISMSWVAFRDLAPEVALERLGLRSTDRTVEWFEADLAGHALGEDWFLIVARGCDSPIISERSLAALTKDTQAIACAVEEHVMCSYAELWARGVRVWRIMHEGDQDVRHLETEGQLPSDFEQALQTAKAQQDAQGEDDPLKVDFIFEVPLNVAKGIVGFRYDDEIPGPDGAAFTVYEFLDPHRHGNRSKWWQIWK